MHWPFALPESEVKESYIEILKTHYLQNGKSLIELFRDIKVYRELNDYISISDCCEQMVNDLTK